jgi:hypothetical protein
VRRGRIWARIRCALVVPLIVPASGWAQNAGLKPSDPDQETIRQLAEQIKQLQQQDHDLLERIKSLEEKQAPALPGTEADASSPPPPPLAQPTVQLPAPPPAPAAMPKDRHDLHGIQVVPSVGMQREALAVFSGAITLVNAPDVKPGMKVIKVDNLLPGAAGYAVH